MIEFKKQANHSVPTALKISEGIRDRIKRGDAVRITPEEHDELAAHYQAVANYAYPAYSCGDCISAVYKTLNNWMNLFEVPKPKGAPRKTKVTEAQEMPDMKLSQMREKWPSIRATSRETFWAKVQELEGGENA